MSGFTTIAESPLGRLIAEFRERRQAILTKNRNDEISLVDSSLKKEFSEAQVKLINQAFDWMTETVLPAFDNGVDPGGFKLYSFKNQCEKLLENTEYLISDPDQLLVHGISENLASWLTSQKFNDKNIDNIKIFLKEKIKNSAGDLVPGWEKIPEFSLNDSLVKIDAAIDNFDFRAYLVEGQFDAEALITNGNFLWHLKEKIEVKNTYQLRIYDPVVYDLFVVFQDLLNGLPNLMDDLVPFLNPKAFQFTILGIGSTLISEPVRKDVGKFNYKITGINEPVYASTIYLRVLNNIRFLLSNAIKSYEQAHAQKVHQRETINNANQQFQLINDAINTLQSYKIPQIEPSKSSAEVVAIYEEELLRVDEHQEKVQELHRLLEEVKETLDENIVYSAVRENARALGNKLGEVQKALIQRKPQLSELLEKAKLKKLADDRLAQANVDDLYKLLEDNFKKIEEVSTAKAETEHLIQEIDEGAEKLSEQFFKLRSQFIEYLPKIIANSTQPPKHPVKIQHQDLNQLIQVFAEWKTILATEKVQTEHAIELRIPLLDAVEKCLNESEKDSFPLKAINKLEVLQGKSKSGLDYFLTAIGDASFDIIRIAFISSDYQIDKKAELYALIDKKRKEYAAVMEKQGGIDALLSEAEDILCQITEIEDNRTFHEEQYGKQKASLVEHQQQLDDLQIEQNRLQAVISFFDSAKNLPDKVNELDAVEGFQEEGVKEYYKQSAFLIEKMNGFKTKIEIHSPYHANLKSILSLKEAADQQMDTYLKHELKRQGATQDLISTQLEEMNQCLSANLHLDAFNGHLEQFCRLRNQLNDCRKTIEFIAKLNPAVAEESVQSLASATAEFEKTARKLEQRANHVIDSMRMRFTPRAMGELKNLSFNADDEGVQNFVIKQNSLDRAYTQIDEFSVEGIQCLQSLLKQFEPETAGIHERLAACLEYQQEFAAIYSEKAAVSENIQDRIKRRNQILISFSNDLEIYFQKRAVRHHHKDFFSSADKDHRRGFIESLELKLAKFKATGQTNEILDLVENEGKEYRGVYLQPLLNRLTLAIKNYNKQVPSTYEAPFHYEEKHFSEQQREELLKKIQVKNVETAERMYSLYKSIQAMKVYGETLKVEHEKEGTTAVQLSEQLSRRVDAFLMENEVSLSENGTVSEEKFQDFDTDFRVHLHSQDDVMSKQRKTWLPIVGNILISLCSAGLALVAKLAYTKLKEGHASGFFTKTARMGLVDDIEESMKKFAVASCA